MPGHMHKRIIVKIDASRRYRYWFFVHDRINSIIAEFDEVGQRGRISIPIAATPIFQECNFLGIHGSTNQHQYNYKEFWAHRFQKYKFNRDKNETNFLISLAIAIVIVKNFNLD